MRDARQVELGHEIPSENYCDQPYVVVTNDGNWLCVLTTGRGLEGEPGQHVVATISTNKGRSWSDLIDIEPPADRMTSWVTAFMVPSGRVYAVYNLEITDESTVHGGHLCYKYSDDHGRSWSDKRYRIPIRETRIDRENVTGGREQFFWCIDKPVVTERGVYFGIPKLREGRPIISGQSWVIHSKNVLTESDPEAVEWKLLPEGDEGVTNPELGAIQEEQNLEVLSDGSIYMAFRTEIGVIGYTISSDGGRSWTTPQPIRYPDGRALRNPRACPKLGKTSDGRFLLWFHNNGFPGWGNSAVRNPVWISGGVEVDGDIAWSQPEILLYASDPTIRGMSYPDFFEQDREFHVSETEKMVARVHHIDRELLEGMWAEHDITGAAAKSSSNRAAGPNPARATRKGPDGDGGANPARSAETSRGGAEGDSVASGNAGSVIRDGLIHEETRALSPGDTFEIPALPGLDGGGFSLELVIEPEAVSPGETVLTSYGVRRRGFEITAAENGALDFQISDARQRWWFDVLDGVEPSQNVISRKSWEWRTDAGILERGKPLHIVFIVDGLAKIVSVVANGKLLDGGDERIQGWWRLNPWLDEINDAGVCTVGEGFSGRISLVRIYNRYLRTAEAVRSFWA